ncbi:hypothetical protein SAMN05892877_119101 [Rhizobium subbaraonis]|uniref:Uncharacterized protein n=1 Tax=Rhizobium subbaraonis TaxID=908946 RepID=A0A285UWD6_9HYPH|nr:hypothetical protein SAMN05892877_119101 [Rhizobium subbaraonis]
MPATSQPVPAVAGLCTICTRGPLAEAGAIGSGLLADALGGVERGGKPPSPRPLTTSMAVILNCVSGAVTDRDHP